jgi:predicted DNA-binding mobile mystery protein A
MDRAVAPLVKEPPVPPSGGWISAVRHALGMSGPQLARRIGITQSGLAKLEAAEQEHGITLERLERAARAMDCHLVYAVVPDAGSFDAIINERAEAVARRVVGTVADNMALEAQDIDPAEQRASIDELKQELLRSPRLLWNEPS